MRKGSEALSDNKSRDEIISSLINYLPKIINFLSNIINFIQPTLTRDIKDINNKDGVIDELEMLLPVLQSLTEEVPLKDININTEDETLKLYKAGMFDMIFGLNDMIKWLKSNDEDESAELLKSAVKLLFKASQQIAQLVETITNDE